MGCAIVAVRERRPTDIAALAAVAIFSIGYSHILACGAQPAVMMMMGTVVIAMLMKTHGDTLAHDTQWHGNGCGECDGNDDDGEDVFA